MEYLTDTILCKALFGVAFLLGLVVGYITWGRGN